GGSSAANAARRAAGPPFPNDARDADSTVSTHLDVSGAPATHIASLMPRRISHQFTGYDVSHPSCATRRAGPPAHSGYKRAGVDISTRTIGMPFTVSDAFGLAKRPIFTCDFPAAPGPVHPRAPRQPTRRPGRRPSYICTRELG